jgi:hypothetical protein
MLNPRLQPGDRRTPKVVPSKGTTGRMPVQPLRQVSLSITSSRTLPNFPLSAFFLRLDVDFAIAIAY